MRKHLWFSLIFIASLALVLAVIVSVVTQSVLAGLGVWFGFGAVMVVIGSLISLYAFKIGAVDGRSPRSDHESIED
jgi:glucan phosphoethanolaminetransferase (alkaline phosphatase superfamily)